MPRTTTKKDEKVTVIVPIYNTEKYLVQCIESILNQTYENLEILLIDDGSTDGSLLLAKKYAKRDSRIKVYHKKNSGLGYTRNFGIDKASGKYITFIDSDDFIKNDAVANLMQAVKNFGADTVISGHDKVDIEGNFLYSEKYNVDEFIGDDVSKKLLPRFIGSLPGLHDSIFTIVPAKLYLLDVIKQNKIRFCSERDLQSEDIVFQLDYFRFAKRVRIINSTTYCYRSNPNSLSTTYKENRFTECLKVYMYVLNQQKLHNLPKELLLRAKKMLFAYTRECMNQENPAYSGLAKKKARDNISKIVHNQILREAVLEYPIYKLEFKQKVYLYMIKYKQIRLLLLASRMGLMR